MNDSVNFAAMRFFNEGRTREAIQAFEAVLHKAPDHADAWRMLVSNPRMVVMQRSFHVVQAQGQCYAELDDDKSAIACLERAVEQDPYNLPALMALGVYHVCPVNFTRHEVFSQGYLTLMS
jgi:tetratricopeptide (TPR) repeat protein